MSFNASSSHLAWTSFSGIPLPEAALTTVRNASADQLQTWTARVLTADTLAQLFG